jgi:F-type H+/Na+-transporting ATPase subunit alpha
LDEIPVTQVSRYEKEFLEMLELKHSDLLSSIASSGELSQEVSDKLKQILSAFTDSFKVSVK